MRTYICPGCQAVFENHGSYRNHARFNQGGCSFEKRFWGRVDKNGPNGCWVWTGVTNERGYGMICWGGNKNYRAHRYVWEQKHGPTPSYQFCLHKCDNRRCVNPDHIFLGSYKENAHDMISKGRAKLYTRAKITKEDAEQIRRDFVRVNSRKSNAKELAGRYGVQVGAIYAVVHGKVWQ